MREADSFPVLEAAPARGEPFFGTIDARDALTPGAGGMIGADSLRVISLGRESRVQGSNKLVRTTFINAIARVARTLTRPSAPVHRQLLMDLSAYPSGPARLCYVMDSTHAVRRVLPSAFANTVRASQAFTDVFLFEIDTVDAAHVHAHFDDWLRSFDALLAPWDANAQLTTADIPVVIHEIPDPARSPSPITAAIDRRDALLARARAEGWPDSAAAGRLLGSSTDDGGKQKASRERAAGRLLGVWSTADRTFYHPRFQFSEAGAVTPAFVRLLETLAENPALTHAADANGWNRLAWLTRRRLELSERSLAEDAAPGGVPEDEDRLDNTARTPEEIFASAPEAVIRLAWEDAEAVRGRL